MSPFSNYLVRSNLYISIAAVAHYLYYAFKYDDGFSIPLIGLIFSATYFGYHILRLNAWKFHKKYIGHENIRFYNRNKISLTFIATILLIVTAILIPHLNCFQWMMIGISICIFFFYEGPFKSLQLRKLFLKPFIIALVWSTFILGVLGSKSFTAYLDSFLFIGLICIAFDLRDYQEDSDENLDSIINLKVFKDTNNLVYLYATFATIRGIFSLEYFYFISIFIFSLGVKLFRSRFISFNLIFDGLIILRFLFYLLQN